jgi:hypothetical protein
MVAYDDDDDDVMLGYRYMVWTKPNCAIEKRSTHAICYVCYVGYVVSCLK